MSRLCDWKDLQELDIFEVTKMMPGAGWQTVLGIYRDTSTLYIVAAGRICLYPSRDPVTRFFPTQYSFKQEVRVFKQDEIPVDRYLGQLTRRVNSSTGTDPEIFVTRGKVKKSLLPAFRFLPTQEEQQKKTPQAFSVTGCFGPLFPAIPYRDGFAAEYFTQPVSCHGYLIDFIRYGLNEVRRAAKAFDRTAELTIKNTFTIPAGVMESAAPTEIALGCMPSLNAYGDSPQLPNNARDFPLRFAGGHVHLGIRDLEEEDAVNIVKACDIIAAIPGVAIFSCLDTPVRRQYYGRAGEYRKPAHGVEYRVLSNAWLATPQVTHLMFNLVRIGAKVGKAGLQGGLGISEEAARDIVNFCDVKAARKFVTKNMAMYSTLMAAEGIARDEKEMRPFHRIIEGGIEELFPSFEDIPGNWKLGHSWQRHSDDLKASWSSVAHKGTL